MPPVKQNDVEITAQETDSPFAIFAIHGGEIEFFTDELARLIASNDVNLYTFSSDSKTDRITSTQFDEPRALALAKHVETIISLHGQQDSDKAHTMVGGLDAKQRTTMITALRSAGFTTKDPAKGLHGLHPDNICNRGSTGSGVQLEISVAQRVALINDRKLRDAYVSAIRSILS